ncbi:hypothetical protein WEU38_03835 [Cyanobacterium aponinum AL20118]|uniref:Uncharacterized protein n=1 Tax=Cyanobacterium aponinum AL20115 TaxID=3090662 RepID=A0AAF0ZJI2_9CHRO|nr:hypothetical protein [Cyanobacterium aponinum]WPF89417.1 hypothetical protein SAY89_03850 [Cyanobacterium aponinum AL20115]
MANHHIKYLGEQTRYKSKWQNTPTKLIRIPELFEGEILAYAHQLDNSNNFTNNHVTAKLKEISLKINNKEKGYKTNSASQLIKDIQQLLDEVN